jgi:E3 ubiquitin-protein ligase BAH
MKFAHELKEALRREGFPPHWVESAVPYGLLKKSIKKVEAELKSLGLDAETLRHLIPPSSSSDIQKSRRGSGDPPLAFQYQFGGKANMHRRELSAD